MLAGSNLNTRWSGGSPSASELVEVGAQRGFHQRGEPAQDPVLVEVGHRVERVEDPLAQLGLGPGLGMTVVGVEAQVEAVDEQAGDACVARGDVLDVARGEGGPALSEVVRERPDDRHLAPGEPGEQHQLGEAVALGVSVPCCEEAGFEALADAGTVLADVLGRRPGQDEAEVVDPRHPTVVGGHLVGVFVQNGHPVVLQQREHRREPDRLAVAVELDVQGRLPGFERVIGTDRQGALGLGSELLEAFDVGHRDLGCTILAVPGGEPALPSGGQHHAGALTELFDQLALEVVRPTPGHAFEPVLELLEIDLGGLAVCWDRDDEVEPRQRRGRERDLEVGGGAAEHRLQDLLDRLAHLGAEPVAGHVHQARDRPPEAVDPGEQPDLASLVEVDDGQDGGEQLVDAGLEELVAGVVLEHDEEAIGVVGAGSEAGSLDQRAHLAPHDREARDRLGVDPRGEQPDEPVLCDHARVGIAPADPDIVHLVGAVDG
jgi:hypothetical protein